MCHPRYPSLVSSERQRSALRYGRTRYEGGQGKLPPPTIGRKLGREDVA